MVRKGALTAVDCSSGTNVSLGRCHFGSKWVFLGLIWDHKCRPTRKASRNSFAARSISTKEFRDNSDNKGRYPTNDPRCRVFPRTIRVTDYTHFLCACGSPRYFRAQAKWRPGRVSWRTSLPSPRSWPWGWRGWGVGIVRARCRWPIIRDDLYVIDYISYNL